MNVLQAQAPYDEQVRAPEKEYGPNIECAGFNPYNNNEGTVIGKYNNFILFGISP